MSKAHAAMLRKKAGVKKPKRITSKQRAARKVNIEKARRAKKYAGKPAAKKTGGVISSKTHSKVLAAPIEKSWGAKGKLLGSKSVVSKVDKYVQTRMSPGHLKKMLGRYGGTGEFRVDMSYRKTRLYSDIAVHLGLHKRR
jgi:hypothetical protein